MKKIVKKTTIKKAQSGAVAVDKTAVAKPKGTAIVTNKPKYTYGDVYKKEAFDTKADSAEYKQGFDYGKMTKKIPIFSSPRFMGGAMEGREDKRPQKKIKYKSGGTVKKAQSGAPMQNLPPGSVAMPMKGGGKMKNKKK